MRYAILLSTAILIFSAGGGVGYKYAELKSDRNLQQSLYFNAALEAQWDVNFLKMLQKNDVDKVALWHKRKIDSALSILSSYKPENIQDKNNAILNSLSCINLYIKNTNMKISEESRKALKLVSNRPIEETYCSPGPK
jgi:hypothetical protein